MILDTFYLLFKTDIPTSTQKEIAGLDKQIDELTKKGKKRSDEENKQHDELRKRRKEATQDLKDQQNQVDKISDSFGSLAQNALGALTAFATFQGLKSGILDAAKLNSNLEIQAKITGQNVDELRTYSAAVESAGGSAEGFLGTLNSMSAAAAQNGVAFTKVGDLFKYVHNQIGGLPKQEQRRVLGLLGVTDPGAIAFLEQGNEEFQKSIDLQERLTKAAREDYESARTFEAARTDALHSLTSAFTRLGSDILPPVSRELAKFDDHIKNIENEKGGVEAFFTEAAAAAGLLIPPLRAISAAILAITVASRYAKEASEWLFGTYNPGGGSFFGSNRGGSSVSVSPTGASSSPTAKTGNPAIDFWLSQGYTPAQAAGLAANEQAESSGNPSAFNRGHYGLYQWDARRRSKILAGTGIDVANASADQQRVAAAWELHARGDDARVRAANSPESAAAIANSYFEVSGENPLHRMQIAHQLSAQYAGAGGAGAGRGMNLKIDTVTINTQATDAGGISRDFAAGLRGHLDDLWSDVNDGVDR